MPLLPSLDYLGLPSKYIEDKDDFYRSGIPEASKIRNLITTCQRLFIAPSSGINLYLLGEKDIYAIEVFDHKTLVCKLYYLPKQLRLDFFDGGDLSTPLFMWKSKKCVYKNIPISLDKTKAESLLLPLLSIL